MAELLQSKCRIGFIRLSSFVYRRPRTIIAISVFLALALGTGFVRFKETNNVRDQFGAENAPSRHEYNVAREFFKELGGLFHLIVAMEASDGGSLLRPNYIEKALAVEEHLQFGLRVEFEGRLWAYSDFCGTQCENSDAVQIFLSLYHNWQQQKKAKGNYVEKSSAVKLTFPSIDVFGNRIYLGNNFFRVQLNNRSGLMESANLIVIYFPAIYPNATMEKVMKKWELAVWQYAADSQNDPLVKICLTSEGLVSEEVRQTGAEAVPLMPFSLAAILLFTVFTSIRSDRIRSKGITALAGLCCPLLSLLASFGLLFWIGLEFLPILVVVPFLVLAVGVDDVFIMLHCWAQTDEKLPLEQRLGVMLAHAGPSMAITSLTNWLSFGIGIFTPVPAIQIFCIFISVAVFFAYIAQLFFYTAVLAISGQFEEAKLLRMNKIPSSPDFETEKGKNCLLTAAAKLLPGMKTFFTTAFNAYVDFLMSRAAKVLLALILLVYWSICSVGISQLRVGLTTEKLFHPNSLLLALYKLQTEVIFREGGQMAVFVNSPGDLRSRENLNGIMSAIKLFEMAPGSVGPISTHFWLNAYIPFTGFHENGSLAFSYKYVHHFLAITEYRRWNHFLHVGTKKQCEDEQPSCVQKFFFTTSFRGAVTWEEKLETVKHWRRLAARFARLNLTVYENDSIYADQLLTIPPVTIQTVTLALLCMGAVLAVFTPSPVIVLTGSLAVLSINLGVFGFLHFWDIDLDPISMMTTLMAIGLSVDFVAHISFHYYKAGQLAQADNTHCGQRERLKHALESIGWPMLQAGLSTMLCVLVLALIRVYMVQVFVKVVLLVVSLGLIHGLVVLPIVYSTISPILNKFMAKPRRKQSQKQKIPPIKIAVGNEAENIDGQIRRH